MGMRIGPNYDSASALGGLAVHPKAPWRRGLSRRA